MSYHKHKDASTFKKESKYVWRIQKLQFRTLYIITVTVLVLYCAIFRINFAISISCGKLLLIYLNIYLPLSCSPCLTNICIHFRMISTNAYKFTVVDKAFWLYMTWPMLLIQRFAVGTSNWESLHLILLLGFALS